jgi:hypothetical protein
MHSSWSSLLLALYDVSMHNREYALAALVGKDRKRFPLFHTCTPSAQLATIGIHLKLALACCNPGCLQSAPVPSAAAYDARYETRYAPLQPCNVFQTISKHYPPPGTIHPQAQSTLRHVCQRHLSHLWSSFWCDGGSRAPSGWPSGSSCRGPPPAWVRQAGNCLSTRCMYLQQQR